MLDIRGSFLSSFMKLYDGIYQKEGIMKQNNQI